MPNTMPQKRVALNRALSKLGILSRVQATTAIRAGRVRVDGLIVRNPLALVTPGRARLEVDGARVHAGRWRTILFHKPRGVVTTRRDPEGRPTVYDVLGSAGDGLIPVGRLDLASTGLLILTNDTALADWITDPASAVPRVYLVTVRGRVTDEDVEPLARGISKGRDILRAYSMTVRKASSRESHLTVELREGKNREIRRLFEAIGHEVTRLKRVRIGDFELGDLKPGEWREVTKSEVSGLRSQV